MDNYKGIYANNNDSDNHRTYEAGAHFKYKDLVRELNYLLQTNPSYKSDNATTNIIYIKKTSSQRPHTKSQQHNYRNNNNIPPSNQSRNIQPLIQSLTQKLSEIVNSNQNKLFTTKNEDEIHNINAIPNNIYNQNNNPSNTNNNNNSNIINNIIVKPNINIALINKNDKQKSRNTNIASNSTSSNNNNFISANTFYYGQRNNNIGNTYSNDTNGTHLRNNSNSLFNKKYSSLQEKITQMKIKTKIELEKLNKNITNSLYINNKSNSNNSAVNIKNMHCGNSSYNNIKEHNISGGINSGIANKSRGVIDIANVQALSRNNRVCQLGLGGLSVGVGSSNSNNNVSSNNRTYGGGFVMKKSLPRNISGNKVDLGSNYYYNSRNNMNIGLNINANSHSSVGGNGLYKGKTYFHS